MNQRCFFSACGWIWGFLKTTYQESNVRGFAQDHLNIRRWMLYCHASLKEKKKKKKRQTGKRVGDHTFIFSCSLFILLLFVSQLSVRILEKEKKSGHFFPPRLSCLFIFSQAIPPLKCLLMNSQLYLL